MTVGHGGADARRRTGALVTPVAAILAAGAVAGCQTTQELSAQRERDAPKYQADTKLARLGRSTPGVRLGRPTLLPGPSTSAVAVEVENTTRKALVGLPIGVRVTAGKASVYTNRTAGLQDSLLKVPALRPGERLVWVNDQVTKGPTGARVKVSGGTARTVPTARLVRLRTSGLRTSSDAGTPTAEGTVKNTGRVVQDDVTVFVVGRRAGRIVAAGTARIPRLAAGRTSSFTAYLEGDPRGARLSAAAPPTTLKDRDSR